MSQLIFVYGTLKRGGSNHRHLAGEKYIGEARTTHGYRMFDAGGYPALVRAPQAQLAIPGEVWEVSDQRLAALDAFEGTHEGLYHRERITLVPPFAQRPIDAYFYGRETTGLRDLGAEWRE